MAYKKRRKKKVLCKYDYPGVYYHHKLQKWAARITSEGQQCFLGVYDTEEEAIEVRQVIESKADIVKAAGKLAAQRRKKRRLIKYKSNSTGQRGVSYSKAGYFRARITVDGQRIELGTFNTVADATKAYREAERNLMH
jgi:hypothetical protein